MDLAQASGGMAVLEDVGELLQRARKSSGLSQEEAAKRAEVSARALTNWETGNVSPKVEDFSRLLAVYGIETLDELCRFVAGDEKLNRRAEAIRDLRPGRTAAEYREMADLLERLERLESIVARDKR